MTDFFQKKELEGRYAVKKLFPTRQYEFTEYKYEFFDAFSTGVCLCIEEIKTYNDPEHPRYHDRTGKGAKIKDFMIDYMKCLLATQQAMNMSYDKGVSNKGDERGRRPQPHRQPLLIGIFWDMVCIWDLDKTKWEDTAEWREVNKKGGEYGEKEWQLMAHLPIEGPEGPIYKKTMNNPEEFWKEVAEEIKKDYPDYTPSWIKE